MMKGRLRPRAEAEAARRAEEWGNLTWLAGEALTGSDVTVGRVVIRPGMANPRHRHDTCEEVLYLLSGRLEHSLGDERVIVSPGDTVIVPAGVPHHARNIGETDAEMIVAYSSGRRDFQLESQTH